MKKIISGFKQPFARALLVLEMLLAALLSMHGAHAQIRDIQAKKPKPCGGYIIDQAALQAAKNFETSRAGRLLSASYSIRVYFHICRNDDGSNAGATDAQIQSEFNRLVADYAPDNICFINVGTNVINNTQINTNLDSDNPSNVAWLNPFLLPNCINIFYHANLLKYGGNAFAIPNTFCSIDKGNIGAGQTISHEVGHCFGLMHTFEPSTGHEDINGSNGTTAADQVKDTPADPYAFNGSSCFTTSSCCYTGNCTDPNGQSNFSPPYTNMMAYWWTFGYTNLAITSGQYSRVNSFLGSNSGLQGCESSSSAVVGPLIITSGFHVYSTINTLTTNGVVSLSGSTVTTFGGGLVLVEPGFDANASGGAVILIRPSICVGNGNRPALETNQEVVPLITNISKTSSNDLKCYPNPFSRKFTIEFNVKKDDDYSIKLYDLAGKQLKVISQSTYTRGTHQVTVDAADLAAGMYILVVQTPEFRKEEKIIKAY